MIMELNDIELKLLLDLVRYELDICDYILNEKPNSDAFISCEARKPLYTNIAIQLMTEINLK
jgi:hypothetical protein